jgi:hypothetical protein
VLLNLEAIPDANLWQNWKLDKPELDLELGKGPFKVKKPFAFAQERFVSWRNSKVSVTLRTGLARLLLELLLWTVAGKLPWSHWCALLQYLRIINFQRNSGLPSGLLNFLCT